MSYLIFNEKTKNSKRVMCIKVNPRISVFEPCTIITIGVYYHNHLSVVVCVCAGARGEGEVF